MAQDGDGPDQHLVAGFDDSQDATHRFCSSLSQVSTTSISLSSIMLAPWPKEPAWRNQLYGSSRLLWCCQVGGAGPRGWMEARDQGTVLSLLATGYLIWRSRIRLLVPNDMGNRGVEPGSVWGVGLLLSRLTRAL
ncbi:unnamed protein product [Rangifer tarandus platyrhynchus]|uniref:Uncharacterized protein n=1 Tax=Rangifer tarandus platyrhynchus TaxID=3082113 RepID=A0AC59ZCM8_RANTA